MNIQTKKFPSKIKEEERRLQTLIDAGTLPEKNEIIISPEGLILIDIDGEITNLDIDVEQVGNLIWCG